MGRARPLFAVLLAAALGAACGATGPPPSTSSGTSVAEPTTAAAAVTSSTSAPPTTSTVAASSPTSTTTTATTATTTAPSTTVAPEPGSLLAIDVLAFITVSNEHRGGYDRALFGYPADLDGDGCDTRAEVLQRESSTPAQVDPYHCTVVAGDWRSPYDGQTFTVPGELEIDHVVALKEAWDSGAWAWSPERLVRYANDVTDQRTLRAVSVAANRDKGDKDPSNWLPSDPADVCPFVADWVAIKARWGLSMDESEHGRIRNLLRGPCAGTTLAPWAPAPADTTTTVQPVVGPIDVYFANCAEARAAGAAPIHRGEPGYRPGLDGDDDGIACE